MVMMVFSGLKVRLASLYRLGDAQHFLHAVEDLHGGQGQKPGFRRRRQ